MKKIVISMTLIGMVTGFSCAHSDEKKYNPPTQYFLDHIAGNMAFTNNYTFRGISQTSEEAAIQGGLTFTFDSKIYVGLWGSNVNFLSLTGEQATSEVDELIGYANTIKDITFDIHFVRYDYARASTTTYNEVIGSISYGFLAFLVGYSGNVYGSHGPGTYTNLSAHFDLPAKYVHYENVVLTGGIGYYNLDSYAGNDYMDYNVQLSKTIGEKYVISIQWVDTNHKNPPYDGCQWVVGIAANF